MRYPYFLLLLFLITASRLLAGTVSGTIYDEKGEVLPGTTIYIQESKTGTASNADGKYLLELEPGSYTIIFRFLGYKTFSQRVSIQNEEVTLDVHLEPQAIMLNEVEIRAGNEDPAYTIMRKAIAKAGYHRNIVDEHESRVYIKGTGNLSSIPFFLRKKLKEEGIDTSRYFVTESVSKMKFSRPASYEETVLSIRSSGDDNNTSPNSYITASFYEPEIVETISPLNPKAFSHYKFEYRGTFEDQDHIVNRIGVVARSTGDHLFNGEINIVEDDWSIHSLKLDASKLGIGITVEQQYREFEEAAWLPVTHKFEVKGKVIGVGFNYKYLASVNYESVNINRELSPEVVVVDEKIEKDRVKALAGLESELRKVEGNEEPPVMTRKEIRKKVKEYEKEERLESEEPDVVLTSTYSIDSLAYKREKDYWTEIRPVPLTKKETIGYRQTDSLAGNIEKDTTAAGKKKRGFSPLHLISGKYYRIDKQNLLYIRDPMSGLTYNSVEGIALDYMVGYRRNTNKNADNPNIVTTSKVFETNAYLKYSLARNVFLPYFTMTWSTRTRPKRSSFSLRGGSRIYQINESEPIHPALNALYTLFMEENYMKLFQADEYKATFSHTFNGKYTLNLGTGYQYRRALSNNATGKIIDWANKEFTPNTPANDYITDTSFPDHNHLYLDASIRMRPWVKYRIRNGRKIALNNSSPTLTLAIRKAIPDVLNGQTSYLRQNTTLEYDLDLNPLGTINIVGTFTSFLEKDRLFFLDYSHFNGNQTIISPGNEYRQLGYYRFSNDQYSLGLNTNFKFQSNKFLARLPFLAKKGVKDFAVVNLLHVPGITLYSEVGYGLDYLFRFMRIEAVVSFLDNNFEGVGIRIGLPPDLVFN